MSEQQFLVHLGKCIKKQRIKSKLTQQQLSTICKLEKANLSRIESGQANPTARTLFKITHALNTNLPQLFDDCKEAMN